MPIAESDAGSGYLMNKGDNEETTAEIGLCATCRHVQEVRGRWVFYRCLRATSDEQFPKYPPLPVRTCSGFEAAEPSDDCA